VNCIASVHKEWARGELWRWYLWSRMFARCDVSLCAARRPTSRPALEAMPVSAVSRCAVGGPSGVAGVALPSSLLDGVYHSRSSSSSSLLPRSSVVPHHIVTNGNNISTVLGNGGSLRKPTQVSEWVWTGSDVKWCHIANELRHEGR